MTLAELNEHFELARELAEAKELLENLEVKVCPKSPKIDGMPRALGANDPVGNLAVEIADVKDAITGLTEELSRSEAKVSAFIRTITDNRTRLIFRLRFIHEMQVHLHVEIFSTRQIQARGYALVYLPRALATSHQGRRYARRTRSPLRF